MSELRNKGRESPDISSQTQDQSNKEPQKKASSWSPDQKLVHCFTTPTHTAPTDWKDPSW